MKTVVILGVSGMLGNGIYSVLKDKYRLILTVRKIENIRLLEEAYGPIEKRHRVVAFDAYYLYRDFVEKKGYKSPYFENFLRELGEVDYVINAIGITIPHSLKDPTMTFFINSAFPHLLAWHFGEKLIHITTDCVFNGKEGFPYDENSSKTPVDLYGLSKSLGEPLNCLTLRTSLIGHELEGHTGLLDWFLQQEGKEIKGFANHFWNGITTREFGRICDKIMSEPKAYPKVGIYHIFSNTLSKYEMLLKFKERYKIHCKIEPDEENKVNRTLATIYDFNEKLKIETFDTMLDDLFINRPKI